MSEELQILADVNAFEIKKYTRRILTARVFIFVLAAICILAVGLNLYTGESNGNITLISFSCLCILYVVLGIISAKKPFVPILIALIINVPLLLFELISLFFALKYNSEIVLVETITLVQACIVFFLFRGIVYAKRVKKLQAAN